MATNLELIERKICGVERQWDTLKAQAEEGTRLMVEGEKLLLANEQALSLAIEVAEKIQTQVHQRVAGLVTQCLRTVFDDPYTFDIRFERKRGKTEARLIFSREDLEVDPLTAAGGGVVDVAAFGLRLACLVLQKPPVRRVLILDEPFRFVSVEYRDRVGQLLEDLSEELEVQIIMVTHMEELTRGTVISL